MSFSPWNGSSFKPPLTIIWNTGNCFHKLLITVKCMYIFKNGIKILKNIIETTKDSLLHIKVAHSVNKLANQSWNPSAFCWEPMLAFLTVSAPHYAWKQIFLFVQHLNILKNTAVLQVKLLIKKSSLATCFTNPLSPWAHNQHLSVLSAYNHLLYCANPRCMLQFQIKINDGGSWLHQHARKYIRTHAHKSKH